MTENNGTKHNKDIQHVGKRQREQIAPLEVDYSYQRPIKPYHRKIAAEWDPQAAGTLTVAVRKDGTRFLVDGQQRREAMLLLGITEWWANVFESDGPEHEAEIYVIVNGGRGTRRSVSQREQFKAKIIAEDEVAVAVQRVVQECGFKLGHVIRQAAWPFVICVARLQEIVSKQGEEMLRRTLSMIAQSWPQQDEACDARIIGGINAVLRQPEVDEERLCEVLKTTQPVALIQRVRSMGVRSMGGFPGMIYGVIAAMYNKRLPSRSARRLPPELPKANYAKGD